MPRPFGSDWGRHSLGASGFRPQIGFRRRQPFRYRSIEGEEVGVSW
jgi:hypothetical protein